MDTSRRAVESYWRSRMIDGATSDDDKVTPVYKLEEICELLRSSHVSLVNEVSEFVLKRLEHKSPIVKQKALRLIKYAVVKSGSEFRREMQRHSVAVRQLIHYKGQPDPLKGDALNKAVRETAQEALSAIFSTEDNKPAASENLSKRIQGFGNTNYEIPSEDKKSFLSEMVGLGSATIKQGLSNLTQSQSLKKDDSGSYKSPNLRRSLTGEIDYSDRYEGVGNHGETENNSQYLKNVTGGTWGQDMRISQTETTNGEPGSSYVESTTCEDRLLETIVTSGGVRLQPTRDALQAFLVEASKLDAVALSRALESKLQSQLWQVRMKAICVLEAILRKKVVEHFSIVLSYFTENKDVVVKCSESPQASLRERANKVLSLLGGDQPGSAVVQQEMPVKASAIQMPDLIDAGDPNYLYEKEDSSQIHDQMLGDLMSSTTGGLDDLFGDTVDAGLTTREHKNDDDPFADVSFHTNNEKGPVTDLFLGMNVNNQGASQVQMPAQKVGTELFDIFGSNTELLPDKGNNEKGIHNLMAGLSMNGDDLLVKQTGTSSGETSTLFPGSSRNKGHQVSNDVFNNMLGSQGAGMNANPMFPMGALAYNLPSGMMFNPALASQPINYGAMGSLFAQQQFLATMSNFPQLGHLQFQNSGVNHAAGTAGEYSSSLPDIFNPSIANQTPSYLMNSSKKEETKAFDFISDHLAAARDPKRVM